MGKVASFSVRLNHLVNDALNYISNASNASNQYGMPRPGIMKVTDNKYNIIGCMMGHVITKNGDVIGFVPVDNMRETFGVDGVMEIADIIAKSAENSKPQLCNVFTTDWDAELKRTGII